MKKILFAFTAVATLSFAFTTFTEVLPIGASIPKADLKLKDISGKEISLKDAKKKNGLLVMFSCNTCPWVIKNQSRTNEIAKYAFSKEIGVVLLNSNEGQRDDADSYSEMKEYAAAQGYERSPQDHDGRDRPEYGRDRDHARAGRQA